MRKRGDRALRQASLAGERWGSQVGRRERGVCVSEGWGVTRSPLTPGAPESVIFLFLLLPRRLALQVGQNKSCPAAPGANSLQPRPTLCDPVACSPAGRLCPWGFSGQESWSGWPCPTSRGSSRPRGQSWVSCMGRRILFRAHTLGSPGNLRVCS